MSRSLTSLKVGHGQDSSSFNSSLPQFRIIMQAAEEQWEDFPSGKMHSHSVESLSRELLNRGLHRKTGRYDKDSSKRFSMHSRWAREAEPNVRLFSLQKSYRGSSSPRRRAADAKVSTETIIQEIGFHLLPLQPVGGRLFFIGLRLHSSSFRNEAGNPGFHHNIKPVSRLDSFINLLHGLFRQSGNFKVLPDVIGVC